MVFSKSCGGGGFALTKMLDHLMDHLSEYRRDFLTATGDVSAYCAAYITGLVRTEAGKRNLERINEELDMSDDGYQRMQQFISDSPWSATGVSSHHAVNTSDLYAAQPGYRARDVGYILDESAHRKKGRHSVGVGRQYAGVIGKVDNCQVGVYASLVWRTHSTLINCRLFLPESWTSDAERCDRAGIPPEARVYKTKQELALEMLDADIKLGVVIDWVGGDALYGHGTEGSPGFQGVMVPCKSRT